jgi:hypothetical protein
MSDNYYNIIDSATKKLAQTQDLLSTSYHESAHAIFALLHFVKVHKIFLEENSETFRIEGTTVYDELLKEINDSELLLYLVTAEISIRYSGSICEQVFFKLTSGSDKLPLFLKEGSEDDTKSAYLLIKKHNLAAPGRKRYLYKKKIIKIISNKLQENWADISLLAHELFRKKRLNYKNIKDLLTKKSENKLFWRSRLRTVEYISDNNLSEEQLKYLILG